MPSPKAQLHRNISQKLPIFHPNEHLKGSVIPYDAGSGSSSLPTRVTEEESITFIYFSAALLLTASAKTQLSPTEHRKHCHKSYESQRIGAKSYDSVAPT